jgi:serine/threonine protein kinase
MSLTQSRAKAPPPDRVGQVVLESFRLLRELGAGSFATAYLAQQEGTERRAVVKIAHSRLMHGRHAEVIASRFAAEFKAATRVQHPNLVTAYTSGQTPDGVPAIAMEYISGMLLRDVLKAKAPLRTSRALRLMQQLVEAVAVLHEARVVHRDISPSNIMVTRRAGAQKVQLKLLDFGIAKLDNEGSKTVGPIGTPRYLAPEQFFGQAYPGSDIYSLGAIFWWMLTGQEHLERPLKQGVPFGRLMALPFQGDPRELQPDIPADIALLCKAMLAYGPQERPSVQRLKATIPRMRREQRSQRRRLGVHTGALHLDIHQTVPPNAFRALGDSLGADSIPGQSLDGAGLAQLTRSGPEPQSLGGHSLASHETFEDPSPFPDLFVQAEASGAVPPPLPPVLPPRRPQTRPSVAAPPPIPTREARDPVEQFIGDMPVWLIELEAAVERVDLGHIATLAQQIVQASDRVQATHTRRLATMVLHLSQEGMFEQVQGLCQELHSEYAKCFPTMLRRMQHNQAIRQEQER